MHAITGKNQLGITAYRKMIDKVRLFKYLVLLLGIVVAVLIILDFYPGMAK